MIAAGITGATLKGGLEIIAKVRAGANPQVLAETQKVFRVEKPPIEPNVKLIFVFDSVERIAFHYNIYINL